MPKKLTLSEFKFKARQVDKCIKINLTILKFFMKITRNM